MPYEFRNLRLLKETEKAYHVEQTDRDGETATQWVPKSVIPYRSTDNRTGLMTLIIEDWFIEKDDCNLIIP